MPVGYFSDLSGTIRTLPTVTSYWYNASSQTTKYVESDIDFAAGARSAYSGDKPILITSIGAYVAGYGGLSRTISYTIYDYNASRSTNNFTASASSSAGYYGEYALSSSFQSYDGYAATFRVNMGGNAYVGTFSGYGVSPYLLINGTTTQVDQAASPKGIFGKYNYIQVPATPSTPSMSASGTSVTVSWSAISDWGDDSSSSRGYIVQISTSSNFSSISTSTAVAYNETSATFNGLSGLTRYYARVFAYNSIYFSTSDTGSPGSNTTGAVTGGWVDTAFGTFKVGRSGDEYYVESVSGSTISLNTTSGTNNFSDFGLTGSNSSSSGTYYANRYYLRASSSYPTKSGTLTVSLRATKSSITEDKSISVSILAPDAPYWQYNSSTVSSSVTLPTATADEEYLSKVFSAYNAQSISTSTSSLNGLNIQTDSLASPKTVTVSGTPSSAGNNISFTMTATGIPDGTTANTKQITAYITINPAPYPTWVDDLLDLDFRIGNSYSSSNNSISAINTNSFELYAGALPDGIVTTESTVGSNRVLTFSGTPTTGQSGSFSYRGIGNNNLTTTVKQYDYTVLPGGKIVISGTPKNTQTMKRYSSASSSWVDLTVGKVYKSGSWQDIDFS